MLEENKKELITEEIPLDEAQLKLRHLEKRKMKLKIYGFKRQVDEITDHIEKDVMNKQMKIQIEKMEEAIEKGEDDDGVKIYDGDKEALKIKIKYLKKDLENDIGNEKLRVQIPDLIENIAFEEKNLKVIEKQIREKKIISTHR